MVEWIRGITRRLPVGVLVVAVGLPVGLVMAGPAHAQDATRDLAFSPRFAVGGGALVSSVFCVEGCDDPAVAGVEAGFEYRLNEDWSVIGEGLWTGSYDVWTFQQDGITYPSLRHDYFSFFIVKFRWQFTDARHRPYLVLGGGARWHRDTDYGYTYAPSGPGQPWRANVEDVTVSETTSTRGVAVFGFGWAIKLADRFEVRPEVDLYTGRFSYGHFNFGVTAWFNF